MTIELGDRSLLAERSFACSRARLFRAWMDPTQLARWWGPKDFKNTFHAFDARAGGKWVFTMHGPTGGNFENEMMFRELVADTRIVLDHISQPRYVATFDFTDGPGGAGSHLRWQMDFETVERFNQVKKFAIPANEENLDRLEAVLAETV